MENFLYTWIYIVEGTFAFAIDSWMWNAPFWRFAPIAAVNFLLQLVYTFFVSRVQIEESILSFTIAQFLFFQFRFQKKGERSNEENASIKVKR